MIYLNHGATFISDDLVVSYCLNSVYDGECGVHIVNIVTIVNIGNIVNIVNIVIIGIFGIFLHSFSLTSDTLIIFLTFGSCLCDMTFGRGGVRKTMDTAHLNT